MKDCPTSREEIEIEQLQQMLSLGDEQTLLKSLITSTQDNFSRTSSEENVRPGHLNLKHVGMTPPHFTSQFQDRWTGKQQQFQC